MLFLFVVTLSLYLVVERRKLFGTCHNCINYSAQKINSDLKKKRMEKPSFSFKLSVFILQVSAKSLSELVGNWGYDAQKVTWFWKCVLKYLEQVFLSFLIPGNNVTSTSGALGALRVHACKNNWLSLCHPHWITERTRVLSLKKKLAFWLTSTALF